MLAEVQTMLESHKANTGSDKRARTVEDQNDDAAMAAQRAHSGSGCFLESEVVAMALASAKV